MKELGEKMKTAIRKDAPAEPRFAFERITLSETGMMASTREYEAVRTKDGARVSLYDGPWNYHDGTDREDCLQGRKEGGPAFYRELAQTFDQLGIASWNGFSKSADGVLDGTMFSFEAILCDGTVLSAHGSNAFPKNYGLFTDFLWNMVK